MQKLLIAAISILCLFWVVGGIAQTDSITPSPIKVVEKKPVLCRIKMNDGSVYSGVIEKQTDSLLFLKSSSGVLIHVPKKQVTSIDFIDGHTSKDSTGNIIFHIPAIAHNYYVATSNAFLMRKGEVYGSSSDFLFYNINKAFSKNFSLGVSASAVLVPVMLHAKANFELAPKFFLGLEGVVGSGSWLSAKSYGGGGMLKLTYGDNKTNFTVSGGYGDVDYFVQARRRGRRGGLGTPGHYQDYNSAIISAAFSYAISAKIYFVGEAFAAPNIGIANVTKPNAVTQVGFYSLSPAIRTNIKHNISWVLGINGFLTSSTSRLGTSTSGLALPYAGFSFSF